MRLAKSSSLPPYSDLNLSYRLIIMATIAAQQPPQKHIPPINLICRLSRSKFPANHFAVELAAQGNWFVHSEGYFDATAVGALSLSLQYRF